MSKSAKINYICSNCGYESQRWLGQCVECKEWNTLEENFEEINKAIASSTPARTYTAAEFANKQSKRQLTKISEVDRVAGGGFVDGQVVLLSGEPGIGKSTIVLQILQKMTASGVASLYVSAEESAQQVALRAGRLFSKSELDDISIMSAADVETILDKITQEKAKFVIVDSIQTMYSSEARGLPGGVSQIKASASKLVAYAKQNDVVMIIIGQVTKQGGVAGPKLLEHLVDTVLELQGDEQRGLRVLRCLKNRYGNANEVGLFVMTEKGLQEVTDPVSFFAENVKKASIGACKTAVVEGNRVLIFEIQALVVDSTYSLPKRVAEGIPRSRLELLTAILSKHGRVNLSNKDVYINVAQGFKVTDRASDLAVISAMYSAIKNKTIDSKKVAVGELSLSGNLQPPVRYSLINNETKRLGYELLAGDITKGSPLTAILKNI